LFVQWHIPLKEERGKGVERWWSYGCRIL